MSTSSPTFSLTVGNGGENHTGMEFIGSMRNEGDGWDEAQLRYAQGILEDIFGLETELICLNDLLDDVEIADDKMPEDAWFLIIREFLTADIHERFLEELTSYEWDKKYFDTRRQRVLNKRARENVCFGEEPRDPDYENKMGTIIGYDQSPLVLKLKYTVEMLMEDEDLIVEGNRYNNIKKHGIGPHGDTERVCVACLRVGESMPMKFGWFYQSNMVGSPFETTLDGGDLYFMSENAVGTKWKCRSKYVLRHAAGAAKYLKFKGEKTENE